MKLTPMMIYWSMMLLAAVALVCAMLRSYRLNNKSAFTKKSISSTLRGMSHLREWQVLDQVTLPGEKGEVTADHLVVGPFGVLVLTDVHQRGNYYGELRDRNWIISAAGEDKPSALRVSVPSPVKNNEDFVSALRTLFAANKIYNIQVETLVPVTQSKIGIFVTGSGELVAPYGRLREVLGRQKYQKDNGVDVQRIVAVLPK